MGSCYVTQEAQLGVCDDLEGWDGGNRKRAQEGGNMCIHVADSCCCTAKTNTMS